MWNKIADGIRKCLAVIIGMKGYSIVSDYELAKDKAKRDNLYAKNAKLEKEIEDLKKRQRLFGRI